MEKEGSGCIGDYWDIEKKDSDCREDVWGIEKKNIYLLRNPENMVELGKKQIGLMIDKVEMERKKYKKKV